MPKFCFTEFLLREEKDEKEEIEEVQDKRIPEAVQILIGDTALLLSTPLWQPLDVIKNRKQAGSIESTSYAALRHFVEKQGISAALKGCSAAFVKQFLQAITKLVTYTYLSNNIQSEKDVTPFSSAAKATVCVASEMCAAFVTTPAEVALIRLTADNTLPPEHRRNYKHAFDAFNRIYKEEGVSTLWRGSVPSIGRTMVFSGVQFACFFQTKEYLLENYNLSEFFISMISAMISEVISSSVSMPLDLAKTRLQLMKSIKGMPQYTGTLDVLFKIVTNEGIFALWKGFLPYCLRQMPQSFLSFFLLERMNDVYSEYMLREEFNHGKDVCREKRGYKNLDKCKSKKVKEIEEEGKDEK